MILRSMKTGRNVVLWTLLLGVFIFHGVLEDTVKSFNILDECFALACFPLALCDYVRRKGKHITKIAGNKRFELILLVIFLLCGLTGNVLYRYQPLWVVAASAILAAKFFMILLSAGYIQKKLGINLEEQELSIEILSLLWFGDYVLSAVMPEMFIRPVEWDICAKSSLLFALLIFCVHKRMWLYRVCLLLMIGMLIISGKEKAYGAIFVFAVLYYITVRREVQTKVRYILYMAVPVIFIAWDKIYYYYVRGHGQYPKSIMTSASLQIARDYFPIGTGFGTFGSTYAANHYSPVYYLYGIADNPVLGEASRQYLTDLFWPILFGETGILGTTIYCGLILILFLRIQRVYYYSKKKYMLLTFMFIYMLMTTFSEAGFMQPMVMVFAYVMGTLMEEYEDKRTDKMKYFGEKDGD